MAVLWQKKIGNQHYEVRTAGKSRRLYKNGVCHSQFNPDNIITGSIWDLLLLPAFFQPENRIRQILVVGGGAVIKQLDTLLNPEAITGIEKDPLHVEIARKHFSLDLDNLELIESDAVTWLIENRKRKFDLIIEDMFTEDARSPVRAIHADNEWIETLVQRLSVRGILVMNFASAREFRESAVYCDMRIRNYFKSIFQLTLPTLNNYVIAMDKREVSQADIHKNIRSVPELERAILSRKLKYRIRKIRILKDRGT